MRVRLHLLGAALATLAAGLAAQSQPPRPTAPIGAPVPGLTAPEPRPQPPSTPMTGSGIIRGQVVRADTGRPLSKARVSVETPGPKSTGEARSATTDADGRYELNDLPAGQYTPVAFKEGFADASYGRTRPFAPLSPIELSAGQILERIDFALITGGVIAGQVLDDAGEPLVGAFVQAVNPRNPSQGAGAVDVTDDLGQFRLFGLPQGNYLVAATDQSLQPETFRRRLGPAGPAIATYYPGTSAPSEAARIQIDAGGEVTGLSITMVPARVATLSGVVRTSSGAVAPAGSSLTILSDTGVRTGVSTLRAGGTFAVPNLPPGRYKVLAARGDQVALAEVPIDGTDVSLALTLNTGSTARGRVTFDTDTPPPGLQSAVRVGMESPTRGLFPPALQAPRPIREDWTFEVPGLIGPQRLRVTVPEGWTVSSIRLDGRDITDSPIEFTGKDVGGIAVQLTQRMTTVTGQTSGERGQNMHAAMVVFFAEEREKWQPGSRFVRAVAVDRDGRFIVRALPPGRYLAVALDVFEQGLESDADALEELRRLGTRLTLAEGESATLSLKLMAAP